MRRPLVVALAYGLTVAIAAGLIGGVVSYNERRLLFDDVKSYLGASAATGASLLDPDQQERLALSAQTTGAEYDAAARPLRSMLGANVAMQRVYSGVIAGNDFVFALDARAKGQATTARISTAGQRIPLPAIVRQMMAADSTVVEDSASVRSGVLNVQAAAPLRARDGRVIGAVVVTLGLNRYNG